LGISLQTRWVANYIKADFSDPERFILDIWRDFSRQISIAILFRACEKRRALSIAVDSAEFLALKAAFDKYEAALKKMPADGRMWGEHQ
jgi:hypothetical protein